MQNFGCALYRNKRVSWVFTLGVPLGNNLPESNGTIAAYRVGIPFAFSVDEGEEYRDVDVVIFCRAYRGCLMQLSGRGHYSP